MASYTLAPWKVLWADIGRRIEVAVVGIQNEKTVCPEHHVMAISLQSPKEAHYICSVLMSAPVQLIVAAYTTTTGISAHVLEHCALADLSERCHQAAADGDVAALLPLQAQVDEAAHRLLAAHLTPVPVPNRKMLAFLEQVEVSHQNRTETDGSNTQRLLKEARGGAMYGGDPTE